MEKIRILVVDDEKNIRSGIVHSLEKSKYQVDQAENGEDALKKFKKSSYPIVITDMKMPKMNGMQLLQEIKKERGQTIVMIITAFADMESAVDAMKNGAYDYISKPFDADQIEVKVNKAADQIILEKDNNLLRDKLKENAEIIGNSLVIKKLKENISIISATNEGVLITGPNGTGKGLIALAIQKNSTRVDKPFVKVNSAAIPESLIEAELFGSTRGSFTGSVENKQGKFQQADTGTIFLDEVGDMSLAAQSKILRVLENGEIEMVGGNESIKVNVRVIAATNQDLPKLIKENKFREDLYYRLNVFPLLSPSLEERKEDIPLLIEYFIKNMGGVSNIQQVMSKEAIDYLKTLKWPGNVRELRNVVKRALLFCKLGQISLEKIKELVNPLFQQDNNHEIPQEMDTSKTFKEACDLFEKQYITKVLQETKHNVSQAANRLDLQRSYLHTKIKAMGIK